MYQTNPKSLKIVITTSLLALIMGLNTACNFKSPFKTAEKLRSQESTPAAAETLESDLEQYCMTPTPETAVVCGEDEHSAADVQAQSAPSYYDFCSNLELMIRKVSPNYTNMKDIVYKALKNTEQLSPGEYSIENAKVSRKSKSVIPNIRYSSTGGDEYHSFHVDGATLSDLIEGTGGPDKAPIFLDTEAASYAAYILPYAMGLGLDDIVDARKANASAAADVNQDLLDEIDMIMNSGRAVLYLNSTDATGAKYPVIGLAEDVGNGAVDKYDLVITQYAYDSILSTLGLGANCGITSN